MLSEQISVMLAKLASGADVMAVVKADAYGHGFSETIKALDSEVSAFGVATLNEALAVMSVTEKTTDIHDTRSTFTR